MDNWPSSLPLPLVSSQTEVAPRAGQMEMESGRVRRRRFFIDPFLVTDVKWSFIRDQFSTFKSFFEETLENGSKTFIISIHGENKVVAFMEGKYSHSHSDGEVSVGGSLQIITNLSVFLTLSGSHIEPILLSGSSDSALQSGVTYGG